MGIFLTIAQVGYTNFCNLLIHTLACLLVLQMPYFFTFVINSQLIRNVKNPNGKVQTVYLPWYLWHAVASHRLIDISISY